MGRDRRAGSSATGRWSRPRTSRSGYTSVSIETSVRCRRRRRRASGCAVAASGTPASGHASTSAVTAAVTVSGSALELFGLVAAIGGRHLERLARVRAKLAHSARRTVFPAIRVRRVAAARDRDDLEALAGARHGHHVERHAFAILDVGGERAGAAGRHRARARAPACSAPRPARPAFGAAMSPPRSCPTSRSFSWCLPQLAPSTHARDRKANRPSWSID